MLIPNLSRRAAFYFLELPPPAPQFRHSYHNFNEFRFIPHNRITMGSRDPYVQFNPDNRVFWASHTGLSVLDDADLDAVYQRAYKFLNDYIRKLIKEHKWKEIDFGQRQILLSLSKDGYVNRFSIPKTFLSFLNPSQFSDWRMQFETGVFEPKKLDNSDNDFFISGPTALSDIFYLLQSIAPGMLIIAGRNGKTDDMGELEWVRALPRAEWVLQNSQMLKYILGGANAYGALLDASRDKEKSFTVSWISPWDEDSSDCRSTGSNIIADDWNDTEYEWPRRPRGLTMCGSECGGCFRCDY